ncbi:Hypothetical protein FKW44_024471 [Caligus rogercresseyi]|uniref:Uncharacterized protein n=1 Tax=Caligus rogercresseyi TaxID=217165 RepID=A0A7T8GMA3_CALRO|nr:Hypothetical protein FKW44_024844 [Caligus rogercresseyi]QQP33181.1 Hypothetical protein FKW44_024471 [Caligus rogercresseyi]
MQNELNTNKYFSLAYSAKDVAVAVNNRVPGSVFLSECSVEGNLPRPSTPPQS